MKSFNYFGSLLGGVFFLGLLSAVNADNNTEFSARCQTLFQFTGNQEAVAEVRNVTYTPYNVTGNVPAFCLASGYINGYTGFQIALPANPAEYTNVFTGQGCGGSCGTYQMFGSHPVFATDEKPAGEGAAWALLRKGYVASMTNMGHDNADYPLKYAGSTGQGTCYTCGANGKIATVGAWTAFKNNRTNEINFGYLSTHLITVAGKEMVKFYYGDYPRYSYWLGGSTGGRQGMVLAQKYPLDYNGIAAGQPPLNETWIGTVLFNWLVRQNFDAAGNPILTNADAGTMNQTALASCDHLDGLVDGIIDNPDMCTIDWDLVKCGSSRVMFNETTCFNETKLKIAKSLYGVPLRSDGTPLTNLKHGFPPGTEAAWINEGYVGLNKTASYLWSFAEEFNKYVVYETDKPDNYTLAEYDFDTDPQKMAFMEQFYYSQNTDLTAFKEAGGKLMLMHSWSDPEIPVGMTLDYYSRMRTMMGGQEKTDEFARLFLPPGMWHVWGFGPGATSGQDIFERLADWVERGIAPDSLTGTKYINGTHAYSRPCYRFPYYAKYTGVGDWRNASNWAPELRNSDLTEYEGQYYKGGFVPSV